MKFTARIDGVHYDPKKGAVKIVLFGASHVSLDELTTLSPNDETIQVTLESKQTKIEVFPLAPIAIDEKGAAWLEEAASKLGESEEPRDPKEAGEILTEFPTPEASEEGEK